MIGDKGWRAVPPALAENSYGCFLPDLTRFTNYAMRGGPPLIVAR